MKVHIQWQNTWGQWRHFQTKQNERDAYRVALTINPQRARGID